VQPAAQAGAVAPFPQQAGSAAALMGCVMMALAAGVGIWIGASFDGTVLPMTLTIGAIATLTALVAVTLVRRHGDVSRHD
jgi:DHA1 family bicyclomycin/chloramphenicol resistance-like MFS transporter